MNEKSRSVLLAIGAFLLTNLKWLLGILKFSKFGTTLLSMIVSLWFYAVFYGWKFAAALVYLIFVHEMGHVLAAKRKGIATSPAVFIPFAGAFISMKDTPRNASTEAYLAYGGPLAGMIAFLPALPLYWWTQDPFWALVIYLGALLNLFNLMPISPLDGGRIVSVLSTKIWLIGLIGLGAMLFANPGPLMVFIFIIGLITWWSRLRESYQHQVLQYEREACSPFSTKSLNGPSWSLRGISVSSLGRKLPCSIDLCRPKAFSSLFYRMKNASSATACAWIGFMPIGSGICLNNGNVNRLRFSTAIPSGQPHLRS